jgi:hypothetical protein
MFFRALKHKRIADAVLGQVHPFINDLDRLLGSVPAGLASDKYVLGFFCANIGVEMQRAATGPLAPVEQGIILSLVLQQLFGRGAVNDKEIGDLLNGRPQMNDEFKRGAESAFKIQAAASGRHKLQDDPDFLAAREVVRQQGRALDFVAPGASEDSKIAGEMLRVLYYQHVIDQHQKARN